MSQIFVPGLKREEICIVRKTRRLPVKGQVLVEEGENVTYDQIIAEAEIKGPEILVDVYDELHVLSPIFDTYTFKRDFIVKKIGDNVVRDEIIARRKAWNLITTTSLSPVNGTIEKIVIPEERTPTSGLVLIRLPSHTVNVEAYIPGKVHKVLENEGAVIETTATYIQGIFGIGRETGGELILLPSQSEILQEDDITDEYAGKIVAVDKNVDLAVLLKAVQVGVNALILGSISDKTLENFIGNKLDVVTGGEDISLTLVVTEGFGQIKMLDKSFDLLKKYEGKMVFVNGATQMRAGVIRPEIIIPHSEISEDTMNKLMKKKADGFSEGVKNGDKIRIIREPHFGKIGYVKKLPETALILESEIETLILEIETDEGKKIIVPRSNTEVIE
jgi:hypothetical protein